VTMIRALASLSAGVALLLSGVSAFGADASTIFGINYDVVETDTNLVSKCKTDPNATVHAKTIIPRYGDPQIRRAVHYQLVGLHDSGFKSLRSIIELYPGHHPSGDLINMNNVDDQTLEAVRDYVRDVRDSGIKSFILGFDMQGSASPRCRKLDWGDCFDPATVPAAVEAERKIIGAAHSVEGISLRVDLLNEACVSQYVPKVANANFATIIRAAVKMHAANFKDIPATVSCQVERSGDGLVGVQRLFSEGGDHVGYYDLHVYPRPKPIEPKALADAAKSLGESHAPVIIGETTYGQPEYRNWIVNAYRAGFHRDPPEIIFWPLHSLPSGCNYDVALPYTLRGALGGG